MSANLRLVIAALVGAYLGTHLGLMIVIAHAVGTAVIR